MSTTATYNEVRKILKSRMEIRMVRLPGSDLEVGMRLLTERDMDKARVNAFSYLADEAKRIGVQPAQLVGVDGDLLDRERARQIVMLAFVQPNGEAFFPSAAAIRETMDALMLQDLMELYEEHQEVRSMKRQLDEEAVSKVLPGLATEGGEMMLSYFDPGTVRRLCRALAERLTKAPA